jgi:hypothetical protein
MSIRENLKQAGYVSIEKLDYGEYLLIDTEGKGEIWFANKGHASYGIKYKNTVLEFARSVK